MIKYVHLIHCTSVSSWKMAWIQSPAAFTSEKIPPKSYKQLCHRGDLYAIKLHKGSWDSCLCSYLRVEGNPRFGKQQCPYSYLQPFPACTPCPAAGVSKRKLNRRRAVKCNVLAMPNQHGLGQDRLQTAGGQPKICYNPELSRAGTPDT